MEEVGEVMVSFGSEKKRVIPPSFLRPPVLFIRHGGYQLLPLMNLSRIDGRATSLTDQKGRKKLPR